MAYRTIDPGIACAFHESFPSVGRCTLCGGLICELCLHWEELAILCAACHRRPWRRLRRATRPLLAISGGVLAIAVLVKLLSLFAFPRLFG